MHADIGPFTVSFEHSKYLLGFNEPPSNKAMVQTVGSIPFLKGEVLFSGRLYRWLGGRLGKSECITAFRRRPSSVREIGRRGLLPSPLRKEWSSLVEMLRILPSLEPGSPEGT
jgi:hypothetical protein